MHLRDGLQTRVTVMQRYDHLVGRGEVMRDPAQERLARALDRLINDICDKRISAKSSSLGWLFARRREPQPVRGLYIHGGVGRGKSAPKYFQRVFAGVRNQRSFKARMSATASLGSSL